MARKHHPTNIRIVPAGAGHLITFDCACGMAGDESWGKTPAAARIRANDICAAHADSWTRRLPGH